MSLINLVSLINAGDNEKAMHCFNETVFKAESLIDEKEYEAAKAILVPMSHLDLSFIPVEARHDLYLLGFLGSVTTEVPLTQTCIREIESMPMTNTLAGMIQAGFMQGVAECLQRKTAITVAPVFA